MRFGGGERIREIRSVSVSRQGGHVNEFRSYRVDHGAEGVSIPPALSKVLHVNAVLPANKQLFIVYFMCTTVFKGFLTEVEQIKHENK